MELVPALFKFKVLVLVLNSTDVFGVCPLKDPTHDGPFYPLSSDIYNGSNRDCGCKTCVRKCCDVDYFLNSDKMCVKNNCSLNIPIYKHRTLVVGRSAGTVGYIPGWPKCPVEEGAHEGQLIENAFYVQEDGRLWTDFEDKYYGFYHYYDYDPYCVDSNENGVVVAHVCALKHVLPVEIEALVMIMGISKMISLPFLLATFVVYAVIPAKNSFTKSLMCYVVTLFGKQLLLVLPKNEILCRFRGMLYLYFSLSMCFWINVMCIDIWLTFRTSGRFRRNSRGQQRNCKRFLRYSLYAWLVPLIFVALVLGISQVADRDIWYNPGVVGQQCWLVEGTPIFLYYDLPRALILAVNFILFSKTVHSIRSVQDETVLLRRHDCMVSKHLGDMKRFKIYFRLFVAMGITWAISIAYWIIQWALPMDMPVTVWFLSNICNSVLGVFIFLLYVVKRSIWTSLQKKCFNAVKKPVLLRGGTFTTTTTEV